MGFQHMTLEKRKAIASKAGKTKNPLKGFGTNRKLAVDAGIKSHLNRKPKK